MRKPGKLTLCAAVAICGLATASATPAGATPRGAGERAAATQCANVEVPVKVGTQAGPIAGTLCVPDGAKTVQLLVPGYTYDRTYWQLPYRPETYSYVQAANKAGYATLAIDPMGSGASIKPVSAFSTFQASVKTVHKVVQALRSGQLGHRFGKVVGVGHSLGSLTISSEAGQFKDLDALVTTGFTHTIEIAGGPPKVVARNMPAVYDRKFAGSGLDPLYVTSIPGARKNFYNTANADPNVIALDEKHKTTKTLVDLATGAMTYNINNVDRDLNIPVFVATGQRDDLFCGFASSDCASDADLAGYERGWYGPRAVVEAYAPPNTGHDITLEKGAATANAKIIDFVGRHVGGAGAKNTRPGTIPPVQAAKPTPLDPVAASVNAAFLRAVLPASDGAVGAINRVPGIGTQRNPIPITGDLLRTIGNVNNAILGTLPNEILATL